MRECLCRAEQPLRRTINKSPGRTHWAMAQRRFLILSLHHIAAQRQSIDGTAEKECGFQTAAFQLFRQPFAEKRTRGLRLRSGNCNFGTCESAPGRSRNHAHGLNYSYRCNSVVSRGFPDRRLWIRLPVARHNRNHSRNRFDSVSARSPVKGRDVDGSIQARR